MLTYLQTFPHRLKRRQQELAAVDNWLAYGETIPTVVLAIILLVLPIQVSVAPFSDWGAVRLGV
jgi:hypothetical protein